MNKQLYRIIFNKARGLLMVVAENVSVRGKQAGTGNAAGGACSVTARLRPLCFSILLSLGMVGTVGAQIVADPSAPRAQQPTVTSAGNGVPLVNIQTPSSKGVSRNTYSQFDVNQQGAILNNAQTNTPTQLGGYVQGNPNLANGTARVILNEVNSSNPSLLHGYVEVAGNRAQVVIANPSGISCDGCGVINASRVTLTTGTPVMNGGNLEGYRVRKGTVSVSGDGLDASRADYTEIIARGVEVNAGIWAKELKITTGANEVSADHSQVTPIEGDGPAPAFGIDVGALGGMYAGKITLVGTESGVGVRNAGQIGASAGNVTITADGRLDNIGHIAASADLHVDTRVGIDNRGTLYAKGNTKLSTRGNVTNAGTVAAQGDTGIDADNVDSRIGSVIAAGLQGDGTWGSNGDVQVSATGLLTALGVNIAAGDLSLAGAAIDITGSQTGARNISISAGDVDASRADVSATQTLEARATGSMWTDGATISAQRLWIDADMLLNQLGLLLQTGMGTLSVRATTRLDNTGGTIASNGSTNIIADALDNSAGFIGAKGNLTANAAQIINTQGGELISEQAIALTGTSLDNRGGILQALGSVTANLGAGSVDNSGGLMRSDATLDVRAASLDNTGTQGANQGLEGQNVTLTADQINNRGGAIRADHALTLTGSGSLDNTQGLISSMQSVHVQDSNAAARTQSVINDGGMLIAGQWLGIDSANLSGDGQLLSLGDMNLSFTGDFTNTGDVLANGDVTLRTDARLTNDGALEAGGTLTVAADNIDNVGQISAGFTQIEAADTLNNRGLVDGSMTYINAGTVNNLGTGRIYGDHVAIQAGTVNNDVENYMAAVIAARWRMDIGARTLSNREHALIFSSGDMSIGGALDASLLATGSADTINNNSASIEALGNLALSADRINNTNEHFSVGMQKSGSEHIIEYQGSGSPNRYKPGDPYVFIYKDESNHLCTPEIPKCVSGTWNYHGYESWTKYDYTRTTSTSVITGSDPGRITSGGAMSIDAGTVFNDNSHIIAGSTLFAEIGDLQNTETTGQKTVVDSGTATSYWRKHQKGKDTTKSSSAIYKPPAVISEIKLTSTLFQDNADPGGSGTQVANLSLTGVQQGAQGANAANVGRITEIPTLDSPDVVRTVGMNTTLPNNSLFGQNPDPAGRYIIETDPRFADYRTWLSSDYQLLLLGLDLDGLEKRLGDGFYEQKLIREQIAQLTGRRFLDGYADDEEQYRALLDNGVTYAEQWNLVPGVALTPAQMAALTSDIVWLVEREVTLADGQSARALVPQVYVRVLPGDLDGSGALMAGRNVSLNLSNELLNQGSIAGRGIVSLTAENVQNLGGRITGGDVVVDARTDLNNLGGLIDAANTLLVTAGRDLNVASTTHSNSNEQGGVTNLSRVAGLYVTGATDGVLVASAGRDFTLTAGQVVNASEGGQTVLLAERDLNLDTLEVSNSHLIDWDGNNGSLPLLRDTGKSSFRTWGSANYRQDSTSQEVGTSIQSSGDVLLSAGNEVNARGAQATSELGTLMVTAGHDVNLTAAKAVYEVDEAHQHTGTSSGLSSTTFTTRDTLSEVAVQGTTLSGNETIVQAGNDINVHGSNVVSTARPILS